MRRHERGFTLIELLAVVTIVGLLAGVAAVQVNTSLKRARSATLKHDLRVMRDLLQQYKVDKKVYPPNPGGIDELVSAGYLRVKPADPMTNSSESWVEVPNEPDPDADETEAEDIGTIDIKSGAPGVDLDGTAYSEY